MRILILLALLASLAACGRTAPDQPAPQLSTPDAATAEVNPTPTASGGTGTFDTPVPGVTTIPTYTVGLTDVEVPGAGTPMPQAGSPTGVALPLVVTPTTSVIVTPTIPLTITGHVLRVELALTAEQQGRGLMFRYSMPEDYGMLFVFPNPQPLSFWMRNTPLPLSIAFIDANKMILNIADMEPFDDQTFHSSNGPALYALEVHQGWFAEHGIQIGDTVEFTLPPE